jgi:PAS domain S-box-containing protein
MMPIMDGLTMAAEIRKLDSKVPIVMLTAFEQTDYLIRSIEIGIDKYIIKPINIKRLSDSLLDCAHRLRVERQLHENEKRFRQMFEDSPDALMLLHDGLFFDCNRTAERMLRCERQQICGQKPEYFSPRFQPDGRLSSDVAAEKTAEALNVGKSSYEWLQQRPDGTLFWADVSLSVITMQGRQVLFSSWRDVSMRRELEEKLQKLMQKD